MIRGLGAVVTCVYGPTVTYAFPDPLVAAYRPSVVHVSLISVLEGTALNWCRKEDLRARRSETVLFGKIKDAELIVLNFRGQVQCRMGGGEARRSNRSLPKNLESKPNSKRHEGSLFSGPQPGRSISRLRRGSWRQYWRETCCPPQFLSSRWWGGWHWGWIAPW